MKKTKVLEKERMYLYFELFVIEIFAILNISRYMRDNELGFGFIFSVVATFILFYFSMTRSVNSPLRKKK